MQAPGGNLHTIFLSWHWRNRLRGKKKANAKWTGMTQTAIIPESSAMSSGWPKNLRIGDVKMYIGRSKTEHKNRTIQDRCIYTPNMSYFLAPNA
ncbi:hypothetical protein EUTSA_v10015135mg [Eutrema salsugineum]|uniref:Uncharacterized protein n=1 Tax=Eutrema salsugineum TaxID=72664 RepID=V4LBG0_EUTSA|nr:hypothetical protein EUTSA_v10015135mg [Eutrema salsugineum]